MQRTNGNGTVTGRQENNNTAGSAETAGQASTHRWGVILAGGDGTRLRPLTRLACGDDRPKQFCPLLGGKTLLAQTRQRISAIIDADKMLFVLTQKHERFFREELKHVPPTQQVVQSRNQGTLPAILWSLFHIARADPSALVAFFPSDHYFAHEDEFIAAVERSFNFAATHDSIVLLGAAAERPESQYGWIEPDHLTDDWLERDFVPVKRFWEKPPQAIARELFDEGCLWNTFVMVGSAAAFLQMIHRAAPVLSKTFAAALANSEPKLDAEKMQLIYGSIQPSDFSKDVLAWSTEWLRVASCGQVGWSDLGEPRRFIQALTNNGAENPWAAANVCNQCGLTREQIVTLSAPADVAASIEDDKKLACSH